MLPGIEAQMTPKDHIVWLAALLEGEGHFACRARQSAIITLAMTDRDVVERAALVLGAPGARFCRPEILIGPRAPRKALWRCAVIGSRAAAWMMTLYGLMGERRREQILMALLRWRAIRASAHGDYRRPVLAAHHLTEGKVCPRCRRLLTFASFAKSRGKPFGLHGQCRACGRIDEQSRPRRQRTQGEREEAPNLL